MFEEEIRLSRRDQAGAWAWELWLQEVGIPASAGQGFCLRVIGSDILKIASSGVPMAEFYASDVNYARG
jgi:hypothetical protein